MHIKMVRSNSFSRPGYQFTRTQRDLIIIGVTLLILLICSIPLQWPERAQQWLRPEIADIELAIAILFLTPSFFAFNRWCDGQRENAARRQVEATLNRQKQDCRILFEALERAHIELSQAYETTIEGWSKALDLRDKETEGHSQRVTEMTLMLARRMSMDEGELVHVRRGALLHDIGKMGIPDALLHKAGPLDEQEWEIMRLHPTYGYNLLEPIPFLRPALAIPYCHHERWDGTGYPRGLKGEEIPLAARIFAVVDVWDALRSDRPYRAGWAEEQVLAYLREQAGAHFDPQVVDAFLAMILESAPASSRRAACWTAKKARGVSSVLKWSKPNMSNAHAMLKLDRQVDSFNR
jgi:HD-GYP domain-containing protein (c-di-GMP phosphodiesterase class II)